MAKTPTFIEKKAVVQITTAFVHIKATNIKLAQVFNSTIYFKLNAGRKSARPYLSIIVRTSSNFQIGISKGIITFQMAIRYGNKPFEISVENSEGILM